MRQRFCQSKIFRESIRGLDVESAIPYTEAVDEGAYKGNGSPFSAYHTKAGLVSEDAASAD